MAKNTVTRRRSTNSKSKTTKKTTAKTTSTANKRTREDQELWYEVGLIVLFAFMVFLFLCNFGMVGPIGVFFKNIMFGLFGLTAYIMPVLLFILTFFGWVNKGHPAARRKMIAGTVLFILIGAVCEMIAGRLNDMEAYNLKDLYQNSIDFSNGGGVIGGSVAYLMNSLLDFWGSVLVLLVLGIICMVFITERSFVKGVQKTGRAVVNRARSDARGMREYAAERAKTREELHYEQLKLKEEQLQGKEGISGGKQALPDRNKKVKGINFYSIFSKLGGEEGTAQRQPEDMLLDVEESAPKDTVDLVATVGIASVASQGVGPVIEAGQEGAAVRQAANPAFQVSRETIARSLPETDELHELRPKSSYHAQERISFGAAESARNQTAYRVTRENEVPKRESAYRAPVHIEKEEQRFIEPEESVDFREAEPVELRVTERTVRVGAADRASSLGTSSSYEKSMAAADTRGAARLKDKQVPVNQMSIDMAKLYQFPPISLLQKGKSNNARDGQKHLEETARRLQECLHTFGVNVAITDISQGPAVTRYELQPEQGVKVSRIVNLSDDIKLNLAATDIRIEAPIPGKSAIGIEVPNKENSAVAFRELIESQEFQSFQSKISFAVGKDIAGKIVVADIAKMPHMLIAGSTGSGKSVCINTLIMSILYKAHPDEVKMIMIDPKVVELSSYNGIPHLLIPVVTDPKQAAGALQWGVSEMMSRYEKFAELNVRDMKGYNAKLDEKAAKGEENLPKKLPQIVIIVDELADLMMVAPGEVEEAICRLAQLARAAGIHLIIATQRPSVDVITGLIKANMPSRVAFAVSSGVDSRTILDMNGAEKLLGKGDMLFYPQGYSKPVRVQGSFVSDAEVGAVVDFLKNQQLGNVYHEDQEEIQSQIINLKSGGGNAGSSTNGRSDDKDALFADAGRFIIEKDKASIGMLQRVFKIGFNRAARIVDQLCEYGVVGDEEGTKPRKVLMSLEQFEALLEEI